MNRRRGVVAAHSLDHVAFDVPDLAEAKRFYEAFGLETTEKNGILEVRAKGDPRPWVYLHDGQGKPKKLRYVSFGIFEDELPAFRERITKQGLDAVAPLAKREHESIWVKDPHGIVVEIGPGPKRTPDVAHVPETSKRLDRGAPLRAQTGRVHPKRLSHILTFTPDIQASVKFYSEVVGLRLTDEAGAVAFMHAPHGSDHHVFAFAMSDAAGLHHLSWIVDSLQEIGIGAMQMAEAGWDKGWGVGRHVLGSNYFHYVRDPWGSYSEYAHDIDYVPVETDWPTSSHKPEDGFYLWGPPPPPDFVTNFESTRKG